MVACPIVELEFTSVELWLVLTSLFTDWLPLPTLMPGLMFAPTFRSVLAMPTFAPMPTLGFTLSVLPLVVPVVEPLMPALVDCESEPDCDRFEDEFTSVELWLVDTLLFTVWLPEPAELPQFTPGLTFAPTLRSLLAIPTFAPTPTFGLTVVLLLALPEVEGVVAAALPDVLDCAPLTPWLIDEVEPMSVELWLVDTPLVTVWLPPPTLMPGETLAPRLTSVLLIPTFAFTPTFGFTLSVLPLSAPDLPVDDEVPGVDEVPEFEEAPDVDEAPELDEVPEADGVVAEALPLNDEPEPVVPETDPWTAVPRVVPAPALVPVVAVPAEPFVVPALAIPEAPPPGELAVPEAVLPAVPPMLPAVPPMLPVVPPMLPVVLPAVLPVPPGLPAVVPAPSGMQSICTGLLERSFDMPVCLSACLPAFGWCKSLQRGLVPAARAASLVAARWCFMPCLDVSAVVCAWLAGALAVARFVALSCASAALDAPSSAATASALM